MGAIESFRLVRVESPWISAGEDKVFLTVIPLEDELTCNWAHGGVNDEGYNKITESEN